MVAYAVIDDFVVPESLPAGSNVTVRILLRNTGDLGYLDYYIDGNPTSQDRYTQVEAGRTPTQVPTGSTIWVDVPIRYFKMPAWGFTLIASNEDGTSTLTRTIILLSAGIHTTININSPDTVVAGETFTAYGNLFETETNILIPGKRVDISYNGKSLVYGYTGPEGDYYIDVNINEGGTWALKAEFPGTPDYKASRSTNVVIATSPIAMALQILGPITIAAVLLAYSG